MNDQFDKLNSTFNVLPYTRTIRWWVPLVYIIILGFSVGFYFKLYEGVSYVADNGLKPSIIRLWEGPK